MKGIPERVTTAITNRRGRYVNHACVRCGQVRLVRIVRDKPRAILCRICNCKGRSKSTTEERFWEKVKVNNSGCWEWQGFLNSDGYGFFRVNRQVQPRAHRFAYELMVAPIPNGLTIDHLCRNRSCVNPSHMEPVTNAENVRRGEVGKTNRNKACCPHGHLYDASNTRMYHGHRNCRACARETARRNRAVLKGALNGHSS